MNILKRTFIVLTVMMFSFATLCMNVEATSSVKETIVDTPVDEAHFPDVNFRDYIKSKFGESLSEIEVLNTTYLIIPSSNISSIKGIEYFKELKDLSCYGNYLINIDLKDNRKLETLFVISNYIEEIDLSHNVELKKVSIPYNKLSKIDFNNNEKLEEIVLKGNNLTNLDFRNNRNLKAIDCSNNKLINVDITNCKDLLEIDCSSNLIEKTDFSNSVNLKKISCANNKLQILSLSKNTNLVELNCMSNSLYAIEFPTQKLYKINIGYQNFIQINVDGNYSYDLKNLYAGIDGSKISNLKRATLDGTVLQDVRNTMVFYDYDCGQVKISVSLSFSDFFKRKVDFETNGGSKVASIIVDNNSQFKIPETMKKGYDFLGWYDENLENEWYHWNYIQGNLTLYAKWQITPYLITYRNVNESFVGENYYSIEDEFKLTEPEIYGQEFIGWTWEGQSSPIKDVTIKKGTTGNLTYTANWKNKLIESIEVPEEITIYLGASGYVSENHYPKDAINDQIRYSTTNSNVANVDSLGFITSVNKGVTYLIAETDSGIRTKCLVRVIDWNDVSDIKVNPANATLSVGKSFNAKVIITPSYAEDSSVTWKSSSASVASVDANGKVTALKAGYTYITATSANGITGKSLVKVVDVNPTGITLNAKNATLSIGKGFQIKGVVSPSNVTNKKVNWSSSNSKIASVDEDGNIKALSSGEVMITGTTKNGVTASCSVKVVSIDPSSVSMNLSSTTLSIGKNFTVKAVVYPSNATNKNIIYSSTNPDVATVDAQGNVKTVGAGTAYIKATTVNGKVGQITVNVLPNPESVTILPKNATVKVGATFKASSLVTPFNAVKNVTYSASTPAVASVDHNGNVKTLHAGYTYITVTTHNGKTASFLLRVVS